MTRQGWSRWGWALALAFVLGYTTTNPELTVPNERSRLYLTVSLYEQHSYAIDVVRARFGTVFDEATFGGHFFSDKAPGASLLALLPYALLRLFVDARDVTLPLLLAMGRYAVVLPFGIAAYFAFEAAGKALGLGPAATRWSALAYLLATPAFHYSAAFFGHQIVATCIIAALWLLIRYRDESSPEAASRVPRSLPRGAPRRILRVARRRLPHLVPRGRALDLVLAGFLTGMAALTEYQSFIAVAILSAFVIGGSPGKRVTSLLLFGAGGLPCALWLAQYHNSCFGGPFELSYRHLSHPLMAEVHGRGLGGVLLPTLAGARGILLSLHRGLLATSPFTLLAPLGCWVFWRRGQRLWAGITASFLLLYTGFVAASATWEAGWGYGPRLLVPILPIVCLCVGATLDRFRSSLIWGFANSGLVVALLSFQAVTALFPEPPNELRNPWLDVVLPLAQRSLFTPNFGSSLGLHGWLSVVPLAIGIALLCSASIRANRHATRSGRWLVYVPVVPLLTAFVIRAAGPSGSRIERDRFVSFAQSLQPMPARSESFRH